MTTNFETVYAPLSRAAGGGVLNAMTVDVEEYYHAHGLAAHFTRDRWPSLERRVVDSTKRILDMFDRHGVRGTFFTLGSVAVEFPSLIRDIVGRGHELASHGMEHYRASDQDPATFLRDVSNAKHALEDAGGVQVNGYRAASFSISDKNWWAFDALEEAGYTYSSSVSTQHHSAFGVQVPNGPFRPGAGALVECPISTTRIVGREMPTGGGFFRLFPYTVFRKSMRVGQADRVAPVVFYYHPWEIDADQPKATVGRKLQFKHYVNLGRMERKVDRLLTDFKWGAMEDAYGQINAATGAEVLPEEEIQIQIERMRNGISTQ